jgi:DNA polymerase-3 subunit epsilon
MGGKRRRRATEARREAAGTEPVVVLDFETTGLSPAQGDRAIEIGAVRVRDGRVVDQFQELMNPGFPVSSFIQNYTGISNAMLRRAPPCAEVMNRFADFIGDDALVAHNASFDRRFLDSELDFVRRRHSGRFACSMLIARRVYQDAPNHRLGELVRHRNIPNDGVFHRALADAEMTAKLWLLMLEDIFDRHGLEAPSFELMQQLSKTPKHQAADFLARHGSA